MHRFVKLAALCAVVVAALTGCAAVDWFTGVGPVEVPRMEQAVDETGKPLFDAQGAPILRPVVGVDGKPVVDVEYRIVNPSAPVSYAGAVLKAVLPDGWGGPAAGVLGLLAGFWATLRKKKADVKAAAAFSNFKAVVAGIRSLVDGKDGDTFSVEDLYKSVSGAAELYAENFDDFKNLVANIKAELRAEAAAKAS